MLRDDLQRSGARFDSRHRWCMIGSRFRKGEAQMAASRTLFWPLSRANEVAGSQHEDTEASISEWVI